MTENLSQEDCNRSNQQGEMPRSAEAEAEADAEARKSMLKAHAGALLQALGQQLDTHLSSLAAFQGAADALTTHCSDMVIEVAKLLEVIHHYQGANAQALAEAELLQRLVGEFAQFVHATGFAATSL